MPDTSKIKIDNCDFSSSTYFKEKPTKIIILLFLQLFHIGLSSGICEWYCRPAYIWGLFQDGEHPSAHYTSGMYKTSG